LPLNTTGMKGDPGFVIDAGGDPFQSLAPPNKSQRFEGIAFSPSGNAIAVATSETNSVFLFRRRANGLFETEPYSSIEGPKSGLKYPHDVSFCRSGDTELLAVAQRGGAITLYEKNRASDSYGPEPVFEIRGPETKLKFSDGVAFVPPADDDLLAVCNLELASISFYRRASRSPLGFKLKPVFVLKHRSLAEPDGLAFSRCGTWLAVANHGNNSVSVFRRRKSIFSRGALRYARRPVTVIRDPRMRYPHSVAFTPETNHLVVTNAGANYFTVYEPSGDDPKLCWSQSPMLQKTVGPDQLFKEVNARNKQEGGPKGVAIHENNLAVCSPEYGIKIYSFREHPRAH
jgi:DNA-binding beta-propeller fold protein YncE